MNPLLEQALKHALPHIIKWLDALYAFNEVTFDIGPYAIKLVRMPVEYKGGFTEVRIGMVRTEAITSGAQRQASGGVSTGSDRSGDTDG